MKRVRTMSGVLAAVLLLGSAAAVLGKDKGWGKRPPADRQNSYRVTLLVSNEEEEAPVTDPLLENAWGIAASATSPWWVANNGTGTSTLYNGDGAKLGLEVQVPGRADGHRFQRGQPIRARLEPAGAFIFASEDGTFSGWNPGFNANASVVFSDPGSVYKGLAIHGNVLYTMDLPSARQSVGGTFRNSTRPANSKIRASPPASVPSDAGSASRSS